MDKQLFDQGWEFSEASGLMAMLVPSVWQPVNLPHDAMIAKPRAAGNPSAGGGAWFPGGAVTYRKSSTSPKSGAGRACSSSLRACT